MKPLTRHRLQPTARWLLQLAGVLAFTFITAHTHAYTKNKPTALAEPAQAAIESIAPCLVDSPSHLSKLQDKSGTTLYERDAFGRILSKTETVNDNPASPSSYKNAYNYALGELSSITYPSGLKVSYQRSAGRITGMTVQEPGGTARNPKPTTPFITNLTHTALGQPKA